MQFYTLKQAPVRPGDTVFRESWIHKLIGVLVSLAFLAIPIVAWSWGGFGRQGGLRILLVVMGLLLALFTLLMGHALRHALGPQNWVVRGRSGGLLVKFRSYLNDHFPEDRAVIVELEPGEIAWLGVTRERRITPADDGVQAENITYLEIKPAFDDLAPLETRLREERQIKVSAKYGDNPVYIAEGGVIRITWRSRSTWLTPKASKAAAQLARVMMVSVRPEARRVKDLVTDPGEERERENRILELAESGDTIGAVKVARKLYGFSLAEARRFVEELQGKKGAPRA